MKTEKTKKRRTNILQKVDFALGKMFFVEENKNLNERQVQAQLDNRYLNFRKK